MNGVVESLILFCRSCSLVVYIKAHERKVRNTGGQDSHDFNMRHFVKKSIYSKRRLFLLCSNF